MVKDLRYVETNSVNPLYLIINKINGYIEESSGNKYLMLVPAYESKGTLKKYEELLTKIRDLIRSKTDNSDNYDVKYMKIKLNSNDLLLNKTLELCDLIIVVRSVFHESDKYYPQVFLDKCLYKV